MNVDRVALERHCELAFASWNSGPVVNYQLGEKAGNKRIRLAWPAMNDEDKAYWRGQWAHLFQSEETP